MKIKNNDKKGYIYSERIKNKKQMNKLNFNNLFKFLL